MTSPVVKLETDDDLGLGVFGIATRLVQAPRSTPAEAPEAAPPSATMIYRPEAEPAAPHRPGQDV